jgi:hypothetical protein
MKKSVLVLVILVTAAIASAATVGIMKMAKNFGGGGAIIIITDKRCKECNAKSVESSIKKTFPEEKIQIIDYSDAKAKKLFKSEKLSKLPAVLLPKRVENSPAYKQVARFAVPGEKYIRLKTGGQFDPTAEICDNTKDDNGDSLVDCKDPTCKSNWLCMEKRERPDVDVFVMSHCPFGTQIEKGLLPVWDLLGDKINLNVRFVDYAMHGQKEIDEQLKQYCIQEVDKAQYRKYLECFLKEGKDDATCLKVAKINEAALKRCVKESDKQFNVSKDYADKSKWKGRFPPFGVHKDLSQKFGVRGSPTLVINEVVAKAGRSPKAILDAVCKGFKETPEECAKQLESANPSPGFGFKKGASASNASCGS